MHKSWVFLISTGCYADFFLFDVILVIDMMQTVIHMQNIMQIVIHMQMLLSKLLFWLIDLQSRGGFLMQTCTDSTVMLIVMQNKLNINVTQIMKLKVNKYTWVRNSCYF